MDTNFTQNQAAWNDSSLGFVNGIPADTGAANAYVITAGNLPFGAPSSYQSGMTIFFIPANSNTGASTIVVGALGTVSILNKAGNALQGGELPANKVVGITYNSVAPAGFRIVTSCNLVLDLGTVTIDQTVACNGYDSVFVRLKSSVTQTRTLTLQNLPQGAQVFVDVNTTAGTLTFKMAATDTASNAYTITAVNTNTGSAIDMVVTGQVAGSPTQFYNGASGFVSTTANPRLNLLSA
jgi:hypothetical protein